MHAHGRAYAIFYAIGRPRLFNRVLLQVRRVSSCGSMRIVPYRTAFNFAESPQTRCRLLPAAPTAALQCKRLGLCLQTLKRRS